MLTLIVGGASSGKSAFAEELLLKSDASVRVYLATMEPYGSEAAERIARHREARRGKGFVTLERSRDLAGAEVPSGSAVLLEDLGNLCANELFSPDGAGENAADAILRGVAALRERCRDLVIVSNEAGTDGARYDADTLRWLGTLAYLHRALARDADAVCEVCALRVIWYKGEQS